ncbi:MAG: tetratricopeptide repeat protein, partial [Myxococcaceae bacterium]
TQIVFFVDQQSAQVASESLWLGQELKTTIKNNEAEEILHLTMLPELKAACNSSEVNLKAALDSWSFSGEDLKTWKKPLRVEDWCFLGNPIQITLRSLDFQKAWPDALSQLHRGYLWTVEVQTEKTWRSVQVSSLEETKDLFEHYSREAKRQTGARKFEAQIYLHEDPEVFAAVLVGDQVASIAAFPDLILGAIKPFNPSINLVRVISFCEDVILILDPNITSELIHDLTLKAKILLQDHSGDGVDALSYDAWVELPEYPCGHFEWRDIPGPYFDLVDAAKDAKTALPPGRAEYLRGLSYELIQSWGKAVEVFRVAFRYNFADGDINHALGRALIEISRFEEAIPFLEKALQLLPEESDVANGLGIAYLESGQKEMAAKTLEKAVTLSPDDAQFLSNLGRCYFSGKRFKEAESVLQKALEYSPNFSEAHATLAQVRWRLGDLPTARKHARKAFAANPGSQYMQDLLWALTIDER